MFKYHNGWLTYLAILTSASSTLTFLLRLVAKAIDVLVENHTGWFDLLTPALLSAPIILFLILLPYFLSFFNANLLIYINEYRRCHNHSRTRRRKRREGRFRSRLDGFLPYGRECECGGPSWRRRGCGAFEVLKYSQGAGVTVSISCRNLACRARYRCWPYWPRPRVGSRTSVQY